MDLFRPKWKHPNVGVRLDAVRQLADQRLLGRVAREDESVQVREEAVRKLADQKLLAKVAQSDPEWSVRVAAIESLADQEVLAEIAVSDLSGSCRARAVEKISTPTLLAKVAIEYDYGRFMGVPAPPQVYYLGVPGPDPNHDYDAARGALLRISEPILLTEIARKAFAPTNRERAIRRLPKVDTSPEVARILAEVARTHPDAGVRSAACSRVNDQRLLAALAETDAEERVRQAALTGLTDEPSLARLAVKKSDAGCGSPRFQLDAVGKITDEGLLFDVAAEAYHTSVREAATRRISKQDLLARIARTNSASPVREIAAAGLTDQRARADVAASDGDRRVREAAVEGLSDQSVLEKVAETDSVVQVRQAACRVLVDQAALARIAEDQKQHPWVRKAALRNLSDEAALRRIAEDPGNPEVQELAERILGFAACVPTNPEEQYVKDTVRFLEGPDAHRSSSVPDGGSGDSSYFNRQQAGYPVLHEFESRLPAMLSLLAEPFLTYLSTWERAFRTHSTVVDKWSAVEKYEDTVDTSHIQALCKAELAKRESARADDRSPPS
jgi:hypothetical protein